MPQYKQPALLQDMATDVLVSFLRTYIQKYRTGGSLRNIRQVVTYIKTYVGPRIPWYLAAEFYHRLVEPRPWVSRGVIHKIIMQVIMDRKIVGLKRTSSELDFLNFNELNRIRGLEELHLSTRLTDMAGLHLGDLRKLIHRFICSDSDLRLIGQNCPKLEYIDVSWSHSVTDVGLRALSPCSHLHSVLASFCPVSLSGINDLLSANKTIRELSAWTRSLDEGFDCFSHSDSSVYPSIESFGMTSDRISDEHLGSIVAKFPNLTSISLTGDVVEDLCVLKSLDKLSSLELSRYFQCAWNSLESLLRCVGSRMKKLSLCSKSVGDVIQNELNFIFKSCENLEHLEFGYSVDFYPQKLVIPPFKNLTNLVFHNRGKCQTIVEFGEMLNIEEITVHNSETTLETVRSLVFSHAEYPKLKILALPESRLRYTSNSVIRKIVEDNNLDVRFNDTPSTAACRNHHNDRPRVDNACSYCPMPTRP